MMEACTKKHKIIANICVVMFAIFVLAFLVYRTVKSPLSITIEIESSRAPHDHGQARQGNGYYEIVSDVDLYSQNGNLIPNCVNPETYTNRDLSSSVTKPANCDHDIYHDHAAANSVEGNFDSNSGHSGDGSGSADSSSGSSDSLTLDYPTKNPFQTPTDSPTKMPSKYPTTSPSKSPTLPTISPVAGYPGTGARTGLSGNVDQHDGGSFEYFWAQSIEGNFDSADSVHPRRRLINAIQSYGNDSTGNDYYQFIKNNLRWGVGSEAKTFGLTARRNIVILNDNIDNNINILPSTKFDEKLVNTSYLLHNSYIFDIPYASLNLLFRNKNINFNKQILNKLKNKIELTNEILAINHDNDDIDFEFDYNKYSPFCNDLTFIEINSDFLYNTKVYLPAADATSNTSNTSYKNCNGPIAKSTHDSQEYIDTIQNKININNCESKLYNPPRGISGIGAQLTAMGHQLAYSISKGYKMVLGNILETHNEFQTFCNQFDNICHDNGTSWDCLLNSISICNCNNSYFNVADHDPVNPVTDLPVLSKIPSNSSADYLKNDLGEIFWYAQMLTYIFKPSDKVNNIINKYKQEIDFNKYRDEGVIGVHIRHGDVCSKTKHLWMRKCNTFDEYMFYINKMNQLYGYKNVFIATDDPQIIKDINQTTIAKYNNYHFIYNNFNRNTYSSDQWIEFRDDINYKTIYIEALIDIKMLSECSAFVGTFSSSLSRNAYSLMIANSGGYKPYASLDTAWCMLNKGGFPC